MFFFVDCSSLRARSVRHGETAVTLLNVPPNLRSFQTAFALRAPAAQTFFMFAKYYRAN